MPNKVKQRWITRQIKRGNPRFVKVDVDSTVEDFSTVEEVVEPIVEESSTVEEVVEPVVVESGTVTDVEVVDEVTSVKKTKKSKK